MKTLVIINGIGFVMVYALVSLIALAFSAVGCAISCCAWPFAVAAKGVLGFRNWIAGGEHVPN
ncbi:hypothetical protein [Cupriavidus taiwanensis]|uniref:hypothetical protein n=1 Tax=Cupriavidus taiwanensis TaxID=164546 RepID=UPI000E139A2A|nr:hypothetical protein [Cupriavidus taiwanensis]SPA44624.1 exported hypothetical protein [Cupriavidus taiwanensis]